MPSKSLENIHGLRWQWEIDGWGKAGFGEKITYFLGKARLQDGGAEFIATFFGIARIFENSTSGSAAILLAIHPSR